MRRIVVGRSCTMQLQVGKLPQKLGDDATALRYIATEPGVGLLFLAPPPP